jgi:hypothetical protein
MRSWDKLVAANTSFALPHLGNKECIMDENKKQQIKAEMKAAIERAEQLSNATWTCECGGTCHLAFQMTTQLILGELSMATLSHFLGTMNDECYYGIFEISLSGLKRNIELAEPKAIEHTQPHADA